MEDVKNKKKNKQRVKDVGMEEYDRQFRADMWQDKHVLSVKLFMGVCPGNDTKRKMQDAPVIILQVQRDDIVKPTGDLSTGYLYYKAPSLCPPPNDGSCGTIE